MTTIAITDPSDLELIKGMINEQAGRSENADRILSAALIEQAAFEDDDIVAIVQSGIKQVVFLFNPSRPEGKQLQSRILNPEALGDDDDVNFAATPIEDLDDRDEIDEITDRLRTSDLARTWLEELNARLEASGDLLEFADGLESAYPDLDSEAFRSAMIDAVGVVSIAGFVESPNA